MQYSPLIGKLLFCSWLQNETLSNDECYWYFVTDVWNDLDIHLVFTSFELSKFSDFVSHAANNPSFAPTLTKDQLILEVVVMFTSPPPSFRLRITFAIHQNLDHQGDQEDTNQSQHFIGLHLFVCPNPNMITDWQKIREELL